MTRATLALVQVALFGRVITGISDASITAACTMVDNQIDSITYPDKISETSATAKQIAVDMLLLDIDRTLYLTAGGSAEDKNAPNPFNSTILDRIQRELTVDAKAADTIANLTD